MTAEEQLAELQDYVKNCLSRGDENEVEKEKENESEKIYCKYCPVNIIGRIRRLCNRRGRHSQNRPGKV